MLPTLIKRYDKKFISFHSSEIAEIVSDYLLFWSEYQYIFIKCNENFSIFTSAKFEWFERWYLLQKSKFSFYFIVSMLMFFWRHNWRYGVDVQYLPHEAVDRPKPTFYLIKII